MSTRKNARIVGNFFARDLVFQEDKSKLVSFSEQSTYRLPYGMGHKSNQLPKLNEAFVVNLGKHGSSNASTFDNSQEPDNAIFQKITTNLQLDVLYLELNLGESYVISRNIFISDDLEPGKISNLKKLASTAGIEPDVLMHKLFITPIITSNYDELLINDAIFHDLSQQLFSEIEINEQDTVVISGEMVWSGWLNSYHILKILQQLQNKFKSDFRVIIDFKGLWQLLVRNSVSGEHAWLFQLQHNEFEEQLYYLKDESKLESSKGLASLELTAGEESRKLVITNDRVGLFDLGESSKYKIKDTILPRYIYIERYKFIDLPDKEEKFHKWWKGLEIRDRDYNYQVLVKNLNYYQRTKIHFPKYINRDFQLNSQEIIDINDNDLLGTEIYYEFAIVDMRGFDIDIKAARLKSHGEYTKKGEDLLRLVGIKGINFKTIKAPMDGIVDHDFSDKGLVIIKTKHERELRAMNRAYSLKGREMGGATMEMNALIIPQFKLIGDSVTGILIGIEELASADKATDKVLLVSDLADFKPDIVSILENNIRGIIIPKVEYDDLVYYLNKFSYELGWISLSILSPFKEDVDKINLKNLTNFRSSYLAIDSEGIKVFLKSKFLADKVADLDIITNYSKDLSVSETIQLLSYSNSNPYVRIEKSYPDQKLLVVASDEAFDTRVANINLIRYSYGK